MGCSPAVATPTKILLGLLLAWGLPSMHAQEPKRVSGSVQISFLPPPLEKATYSLGVFDAKTGKLVRQLQTAAPEKDFTVGLNGLITLWDGKDNAGKPAAPGRYAARGYAIGALKIEGKDVLGNGWTADNEALRIASVQAIAMVPADEGLAVLATDPQGRLLAARYGGAKTALLWQQMAPAATETKQAKPPYELLLTEDSLQACTDDWACTFALADGKAALLTSMKHPAGSSSIGKGRDGTDWEIKEGVLIQTASGGERLRALEPKAGEPVPVAVAASQTVDKLYLLEKMPGWERVRGLSWVETKEESGHPVSTWQTFFERNIRAPDQTADADLPTGKAAAPVEINLDENPLAPGRVQKIGLVATFDTKGSYLATPDGLRLRQVSERANLVNAYLAKGKPPSPLEFFQYDGAATDVFSVKGLHNMMAFDAGEFELTANGEKPVAPKPTEPPDL